MSSLTDRDGVRFGGRPGFGRFHAIQYALLPWWLRAYVTGPCLVYLFVVGGHEWSELAADPSATIGDLLFALVLLLLYCGLRRYGNRRAWKQVLALHGAVSGSADDAGIRWNTSLSEASFPWAKFIKLRRRRDLLLLHYTPRCALYFPREFFASEEAWKTFGALAAARMARAD